MKEEKHTESITEKVKEVFLRVATQTDAIIKHNKKYGMPIKIAFPEIYQHKFPEGKMLILSYDDLKEIINIVKSCKK